MCRMVVVKVSNQSIILNDLHLGSDVPADEILNYLERVQQLVDSNSSNVVLYTGDKVEREKPKGDE